MCPHAHALVSDHDSDHDRLVARPIDDACAFVAQVTERITPEIDWVTLGI